MISRVEKHYKDDYEQRFTSNWSYMAYYYTIKQRKEIGRNIRKARKNRELKQVEVATDAGLNPSYYGKIERGVVNPSMEKIYRIIKALRVKSSDILPF